MVAELLFGTSPLERQFGPQGPQQRQHSHVVAESCDTSLAIQYQPPLEQQFESLGPQQRQNIVVVAESLFGTSPLERQFGSQGPQQRQHSHVVAESLFSTNPPRTAVRVAGTYTPRGMVPGR